MGNEESEQTRILREILKWIKFAGMKELKAILVSVLNTEQKKLVYQMSDGSRGTVEIAKVAGFGSNKTVADMWESWLKLSLGEAVPVKGGTRFRRSFDLSEIGIDVPQVRETLQVKTPPTDLQPNA